MSKSFEQVLPAIKIGLKARREGWNGKGMYILLVKGQAVTQSIDAAYGPNTPPLDVQDAIFMMTTQDTLVPWIASKSDLLAKDWGLVL